MAESETPGHGFPRGGVFNASVDAIVVMSADGLVTDWNPAAEELFGHTREQAVGRELAELIIPESLREMHRAALARWRETGEHTVLNRRLELFGLQANGLTIPVELTITALTDSPSPLFAGFLRDRRAGANRSI
jgi:PAS domain S-box-containing protein